MSQDDLADRLDAVERRLNAAYPEPTDGTDGDAVERIDGFAERLADLEAAVEAVEGYVGEIERVDEELERRADAALASTDDLETRVAAIEERVPAGDDGTGLDDRLEQQTAALEALQGEIQSLDGRLSAIEPPDPTDSTGATDTAPGRTDDAHQGTAGTRASGVETASEAGQPERAREFPGRRASGEAAAPHGSTGRPDPESDPHRCTCDRSRSGAPGKQGHGGTAVSSATDGGIEPRATNDGTGQPGAAAFDRAPGDGGVDGSTAGEADAGESLVGTSRVAARERRADAPPDRSPSSQSASPNASAPDREPPQTAPGTSADATRDGAVSGWGPGAADDADGSAGGAGRSGGTSSARSGGRSSARSGAAGGDWTESSSETLLDRLRSLL